MREPSGCGNRSSVDKDSLDQVPQVKVTSVSVETLNSCCKLTNGNTCPNYHRSMLFLESTDDWRFAPYLMRAAIHPFIYLYTATVELPTSVQAAGYPVFSSVSPPVSDNSGKRWLWSLIDRDAGLNTSLCRAVNSTSSLYCMLLLIAPMQQRAACR